RRCCPSPRMGRRPAAGARRRRGGGRPPRGGAATPRPAPPRGPPPPRRRRAGGAAPPPRPPPPPPPPPPPAPRPGAGGAPAGGGEAMAVRLRRVKFMRAATPSPHLSRKRERGHLRLRQAHCRQFKRISQKPLSRSRERFGEGLCLTSCRRSCRSPGAAGCTG